MAHQHTPEYIHGYNRYLSHPLLGTHPNWTGVMLGYLILGCVLVVASGWRAQFERISGPHLPGVFDQLAALTIILAVGSTLVLAILYPLLNGGPLLSFIIPVAHPVAGGFAVGSIALDIDLTLALASGSFGATIATYRLVRASEDPDMHATWRYVVDGAVITSVGTGLAMFSIFEVASVLGPHAKLGLWIALAAVSGAVLGLVIIWRWLLNSSSSELQIRTGAE